jgi:hypothetical protein
MELGVYNPWGGPNHKAHRPQCEYLSADRTQPGITITHFIGGRGSAKTTSGVIKLCETALNTHPGIRGFWSEPRHSEIEKVFLPELRKVCPHEDSIWKLVTRQGARFIEWCNGSVTDLLSRNVDNPRRKSNVGSNYGYGFVDEAALGFTVETINDLMNGVRDTSGPYRFVDMLTTPQMNGYYNFVTASKDRVIRARSYDNPWLDPADIDSMAAHMAPEYVKQEIEGEWITGTGRIWTGYVDAPWPEGNKHGAEWDPEKPWWLFADLGSAQASYQIMQQVEGAVDPRTGYRYNERIDVIVGEVLANNISWSSAFHLINEKYAKERAAVVGGDGRPVEVCIGHDVATRGNDGNAVSLHLKQMGWQYRSPSGLLTEKAIQQQVLASRLQNGLGERRLCISSKLRRHEHEWSPGRPKNRGVEMMLLTDSYPDVTSRDVFIKDKKTKGTDAIEDDRDALLYGMILLHTPNWARKAPGKMAT